VFTQSVSVQKLLKNEEELEKSQPVTSKHSEPVSANVSQRAEPGSPKREIKSPLKKSKTMKKRLTFNIPYTGTDQPFIDGEGVSSLGREGAGLKKYPYIAEKMNEHDPIYPNGKTFLSATT